MMIILAILLFVFSLYLALKHPKLFIIFYISATTKFYGFIDVGFILVAGKDIGFFILNIVSIMAALINGNLVRLKKVEFYYCLTLLSVAVYGLVWPIFLGSSLIENIVSAKSFLSVFFGVYLISVGRYFELQFIYKTFVNIGMYFSVVLVIVALVPVAPPLYLEQSGYVRVFHASYISLAAYLICYDMNKHKWNVKSVLLLVFMVIALVLTGYTSITFTTIMGIMILMLMKDSIRISAKSSLIVIYLLLGGSGLILVSDIATERINTSVNSIVDGSDTSLISRKVFNEHRWQAINDRPLTGFGFIGNNSEEVKRYISAEDNRFMNSLFTIDSGYIDLVIKLGIPLTVFLMCLLFFLMRKLYLIANDKTLAFSLMIYVYQMYGVNLTWSVFTYQHGLIPIFICVWIINSNRTDY